ncbi:hypothetical protein DSM106972_067180 [Dulcicalothrix desertica PCC 7102]|uniref:GIY-YIG domain-containing protein n=1 Tax=Dulcicalothrix desertica PCC 7102 TaxID=232991 RepID=A0A3S1AIK2_9CYAN|nr:GIY-YIG nuclease family protein [Dulcicalothrix desertica]RUT01621.1 hypothetical protein DSM106972_067180 [Dulcicalothrix desertica PCC 7102]
MSSFPEIKQCDQYLDKEFIETLKEILTGKTLLAETKEQAIELIKNYPQTGYIYSIICLSNSRMYVGQTKNFEQRMKTHIKELGNSHEIRNMRETWENSEEYLRSCAGRGKSILFKSDWVFLGIEAFVVKVVEQVNEYLLLDRVKYWQNKLNAVYSEQKIYRIPYPYTPEEAYQQIMYNLTAYNHVDKPYHSQDDIPMNNFAV